MYPTETPLSKCTIIIIYSLTAVTILLIIILSVTVTPDQGCSIDMNTDFSNPHPLLLQINSPEFILPTNGSTISFTRGENFRLACPGANNSLTINKADLTTLTCIKDQIFLIGGSYHLFNTLTCANWSESTVRKTGKKCAEIHEETEIGFNTSAGFVKIISTCFDDVKKDSLYSVHNLSSKINYTQQTDSPKFSPANFYEDIKPDELYKYSNQQAVFKKILGVSTEFITTNKNFNKGHLAPKGDFIYATQKRATYYYINVAPQWNEFNGGNWNQLENSCRNFAIKQKLNLFVYTGIFGNAQLSDKLNNLHNISLYSAENNKLTVPEVFWKILYEPVSKLATVFIGHNNPQESNFKKLCTNVCDKINWLTWKPEDKNQGLSYCCEYTVELNKIISYLPNIEVKGQLV